MLVTLSTATENTVSGAVTFALTQCDRSGYKLGMHPDHPLKAYREQQTPPMRRADLSRLLGVAKTTIKRWETGERQIDVGLVPGIAEKTGIAPRDLRRDLVERHEEIFGEAQ